MSGPAAPLAEALRAAVLAQRFDTTPDRQRGGAPVEAFPSIDLAVMRFAGGGRSALAANVLFSREFPQGLVASPKRATTRGTSAAWVAAVTPILLLAVLVAWPFLDRNPSRRPKDRIVALVFGAVVATALIALTYLGWAA